MPSAPTPVTTLPPAEPAMIPAEPLMPRRNGWQTARRYLQLTLSAIGAFAALIVGGVLLIGGLMDGAAVSAAVGGLILLGLFGLIVWVAARGRKTALRVSNTLVAKLSAGMRHCQRCDADFREEGAPLRRVSWVETAGCLVGSAIVIGWGLYLALGLYALVSLDSDLELATDYPKGLTYAKVTVYSVLSLALGVQGFIYTRKMQRWRRVCCPQCGKSCGFSREYESDGAPLFD